MAKSNKTKPSRVFFIKDSVHGSMAGPANKAESYLRDAQSRLIGALINVNDSLENLGDCVNRFTAETVLDAFLLVKRYVEEKPLENREEKKAA
jgi:hypothetical protein